MLKAINEDKLLQINVLNMQVNACYKSIRKTAK